MKIKSISTIKLMAIDIAMLSVFMDIIYFINRNTISIAVSAIYLLIAAVVELFGFAVITGILYFIANKIFKNTIQAVFCTKIAATSLLIKTLLSFLKIILKILYVEAFVILSALIAVITINIIIKMYEAELKDCKGKPVIFGALMILLFLV